MKFLYEYGDFFYIFLHITALSIAEKKQHTLLADINLARLLLDIEG